MDNLSTSQDITSHNEHFMSRLVRSIALSQEQFSLILVRCNYARLQLKLIGELEQKSPIPIQKLILPESVETLYTTISLAIENQPPAALMVLGLESVTSLDHLLNSTNQVRDEFRKHFPFPLILWITDEVATKLIRLAPDFKSWAAATLKFELATCELIEYLKQQANILFSFAELKIKEGELVSQYSLSSLQFCQDNYDFSPGSRRRGELESAWRDLKNRGYQLEPTLEACREFIWGLDRDRNDQSDLARIHYQKSFLALLHDDRDEGGEKTRGSGEELSEPEGNIKNGEKSIIKYRGIVLFYIALTYRLQAARNPSLSESLLGKAQVSLEQCQQVFEQAKRSDLVAGVMSYRGELLQRLHKWDELQTFVQRMLKMHLSYGTPRQLAKDYGFLAEVALQHSQWSKAHRLARLALTILPKSEPVSSRSVYLLLLARSSKHLGEWERAIEVLEQAQTGTEVEYDPQLYISILAELRSIYYEQGQYLQAFRIKKKQRETEHQYGFRAFIGADQLQPTKQVINPSSLKVETPMMMAEEIMASCRRKDINELLQRLGRDDHKLIVIHGRSGVGKSSLVNAGLVPALRNMSLSARHVLPVVVRSYTHWSKEIEQGLAKAILAQENFRSKQQIDLKKNWHKVLAQAANRPWKMAKEQAFTFILNPDCFVLKSLSRNTDKNLITVLIFDQFEEFFFVNSRSEVCAFSQFIRICLDLPFVKIILSLREDYLHYLLECENLVKMDAINNNILDKKNRYHLRDFSKTEAKAVIERLTQRAKFELEPALIETLVEDLTDEQGEVRPIELQVVGAQLQEEGEQGITTLAQYKQLGKNPKAELIKHSIEQVIQDCGKENEDAAWDVLFALTDEKFTRPIKTRRELVAAIRSNYKLDPLENSEEPASFIDVILESGLLLRQREKPCVRITSIPENRYQLLHDYLVLPIRQRYAIKEQQRRTEIHQRLRQAQAAKKEAEAALQKMSQKQLMDRNRLLKQLLGLAIITAIGLGFTAKIAYKQKQLANIATLTAASDALYFSHQKFDAIMESLRAAKRLSQLKQLSRLNFDLENIEIQIAATLQQAVYGIHELNRLEGHNEVVWDVSFSPNGKMIASGSVDKMIKVWTPEGRLLQTLKGHQKSITSVSFSPDGQTIASSSQDKTVKLWKLANESKIVENPITLSGHTDMVSSVSFSPDGEIIASASEDKTVKLWNGNGELIRTITTHHSSLNWVSFSPEGEAIATAGNDGTARIFTLTGQRIATLRHSSSNPSKVYTVSFSPDGELIATVGSDRTLKLWSRQGRLLKILRGHEQLIYGVEFSPDSQKIATASADKTVKLWSRDGELLKTFQGHGDQVTNVSFSPDGKILASSSYDKKVKLWHIDDIPLKILQGHRDRVLAVGFSPDGQILASASQDQTVRLWSRDGSWLQTLTGYKDRVSAISFSPDGQLLATASYDNTVKLWRLDGINSHPFFEGTGSYQSPVTLRVRSRSLMEATKTALRTSHPPGSQSLLDGSHQDRAANPSPVIRVVSKQFLPISLSPYLPISPPPHLPISPSLVSEVETWTAHNESVMSVSFSPDSELMVTGSKDKTIKLWTSKGRLLRTFKGHQGWVNSVSFSPDGRMIVSASDDGTVKLWNLRGKLLKTISAHEAYVLGVSFSPDGRMIASAGYDNTVKLWSREGVLLETLLKGSSDSVTSVVFSPDGQLIASASYDGYVRLWSRHNGTLLKTLLGHHDSVMSISFSPDSKVLASASRDRKVILWNLDLDDLTQRACQWVGNYLKYNPYVSNEDRRLCPLTGSRE
ncbi:eIF2A-related protein [Capilliphycus salinus ALCB114379]|uniref:WD40 domain-containing protein n=1 Tax=Capilliphycus salinus TaxID=2768948 RepID=UPI0039A4C003